MLRLTCHDNSSLPTGRTRIADFGLAAAVPAEGLLKCCGTRGYWAPEMIARPKVPYFLAVDWFALGVRRQYIQ